MEVVVGGECFLFAGGGLEDELGRVGLGFGYWDWWARLDLGSERRLELGEEARVGGAGLGSDPGHFEDTGLGSEVSGW